MEETDAIDYERVLASLRERRDKLNSAIAALEEIVGQPPQAAAAGVEGMPSDGSQMGPEKNSRRQTHLPGNVVASDTFFNMSASDAGRKYLNMIKRPASNKEIADALIRGGYLSNAKNFYANLYTTLLRTPGFMKVKKEWGLSEWYQSRRTERSPEGKKES